MKSLSDSKNCLNKLTLCFKNRILESCYEESRFKTLSTLSVTTLLLTLLFSLFSIFYNIFHSVNNLQVHGRPLFNELNCVIILCSVTSLIGLLILLCLITKNKLLLALKSVQLPSNLTDCLSSNLQSRQKRSPHITFHLSLNVLNYLFLDCVLQNIFSGFKLINNSSKNGADFAITTDTILLIIMALKIFFVILVNTKFKLLIISAVIGLIYQWTLYFAIGNHLGLKYDIYKTLISFIHLLFAYLIERFVKLSFNQRFSNEYQADWFKATLNNLQNGVMTIDKNDIIYYNSFVENKLSNVILSNKRRESVKDKGKINTLLMENSQKKNNNSIYQGYKQSTENIMKYTKQNSLIKSCNNQPPKTNFCKVHSYLQPNRRSQYQLFST